MVLVQYIPTVLLLYCVYEIEGSPRTAEFVWAYSTAEKQAPRVIFERQIQPLLFI